MSPRFLEIIPIVLEHEGGFNNVKGDGGGATNFGVSLRFLETLDHNVADVNHDGMVNWLDIKDLTKEEAEELYYNNFWKPYYETISKIVAYKMFDVNVNAGQQRSIILLQRSLNALGSKLGEDGVIGGKTFTEIKKYDEHKIVATYCQKQKEFYEAIVAKKPDQAKFLNGWINRAKWFFA